MAISLAGITNENTGKILLVAWV